MNALDLSKLQDRGMMKWQGMMMPEHVALIREHQIAQGKAPRPQLDEWDLEIIQESIEIAMKRNVDVEIKTWKHGVFSSQVGRITWVDLKRGAIEMEDTTKSLILQLNEIVDVSILE